MQDRDDENDVAPVPAYASYGSNPLRELEADGFLLRRDFHEVPPRVEYTPTELGKSFIAVLDFMKAWGDAHLNEAE